MKEKFVNLLLYGGITSEEYKSIAIERNDYNEHIWRVAALLCWLVSCYLTISSYSIDDLAANRPSYLLLLGSSTVLGIMMLLFAKRSGVILNTLISLYFVVVLAFGIFLGVAQSLDQMTVTFHVIMISVPLIVILSPLHVFSIEFIMLCLYCVICLQLKDEAVLSIDIFNGITFFAVAQFMNIITLKSKLNELLLRKKIEYFSFNDQLTHLLNRNAYENDIAELGKNTLDSHLVLFSIDVNGLKRTNDSLGHAAGDEIICATADCLHKVFANVGKTYRIGGDEFVVIASLAKEDIDVYHQKLQKEVDQWHGLFSASLSISVGAVSVYEFPNMKIEEMAKISDSRMYAEKETYYNALKNK